MRHPNIRRINLVKKVFIGKETTVRPQYSTRSVFIKRLNHHITNEKNCAPYEQLPSSFMKLGENDELKGPAICIKGTGVHNSFEES